MKPIRFGIGVEGPNGHDIGLSGNDPCVHHWMIAGPDGQKSPARCRLCGAEREFWSATHYRSYNKMAANRDAD